MKRTIPYMLATSLATAPLLADDEPFKVKAYYNHIDKAKFTHTRSERDHHLTFSSAWLLGKYTHKLDNGRAVSVGVGYNNTQFHFTHHPRHTSFEQRHFNNVLFHLGAKTTELEGWKWKANLLAQVDSQHFHLQRYTYFMGELYGRYSWHQNRNLYAGILGFGGMRYSRALPIVGFDYTFSDRWKVNAIFPLDMAVIYALNSNWSVDAAIRFFLNRQRFGEHGTFRRGFVAYTNWGAEAGLNYVFNDRIKIKLHVGDAFAGRMRISNHNDGHRKHLKLDSSIYYGLDASLAF